MQLLAYLVTLILLLQITITKIEPVVTPRSISTSTFACLRTKNYTSATFVVQFDKQGPIPQTIQNVVNGLNSGFFENFVVLPCRGNSFQTEANRIIQFYSEYVKDSKDKPTVWVAASGGLGYDCDWKEQKDGKNCQFLLNLGKQLYKEGIKLGVPLLKQAWSIFYNSQCAGAQSLYDLMYIQFDQQPNFDNYDQIGMWKKPSAKLYSFQSQICGVQFDMLYIPD